MRAQSPLARALVVSLVVLLGAPGAYGFDDRLTHPDLTEASVRASRLGPRLTGELALPGGIEHVLSADGSTRPIVEWLRGGAQREDVPGCRARNHFHNPLRSFGASGVTDLPFFVRAACASTPFDLTFSSPLWGTRYASPTDRTSGVGNPFDWDVARSAYLDALTLASPAEREAALARTFDTLGHVMHLVQDLAVPAHVRNDFLSHLQYLNPIAGFERMTENGFERFVRLHPHLVGEATARMGEVPAAGLPVVRFWDRDLYVGQTPSADPAHAWGLAEYTNANFASQSTIFTESSPPTTPSTSPIRGRAAPICTRS